MNGNRVKEILDRDLKERMAWVETRLMEYGVTLEELDIQYTDDPEDDHILVLEALNDKLEERCRGFKKLVFPL